MYSDEPQLKHMVSIFALSSVEINSSSDTSISFSNSTSDNILLFSDASIFHFQDDSFTGSSSNSILLLKAKVTPQV
ncbi:hypothetical protein RCL_jg22276.t1 [Rhizophagus clarus]|uniref:Uncharacterized protein n=1 Tax=Rhizophagus clarus TaxID=94130 RepID=A0A8H3L7E0_9GLOM|nr:hypothetical protein RCL_jg22276.t1 [Rhizophagus clarus]